MFSKNDFYTFVYGTRIGNSNAPSFLKLRSSNSFIVATIVIAVFTDIFLYSLVVPVLPFALTVRAGVKEQDLQKWTSIFLAVYGAALAIGSPIFGWFADRSSSRRVPLLLGLLALGGATAMLCAGSSLGLLVTGRFLQGLSASVVWTVGLALLSDTMDKENIGQAMGYVAAATSVGSLAGPLLGGVVYAHAGYYAVFAIGFGIIGVDIILRLMMVEKSVAQQWQSPEVETPTSVSEPKEEPSQNPDPDAIRSAPTQEPASDTEKVDIKPLPAWTRRLPPFITLLRIPRILVALFGCFVQSTALASFDSSLPLYVKNIFSWNSSGAGLIFICLVIPALSSPLVGIVSDKYGSRAITTIGLLGSVPFWVLLRFVTHNTIEQKVLLCALLALIGLCMTFVMAPLMADIDHAVALEEKKRPGSLGKRGAAAQGFGLFNLAYAIGTMIGPLWAGFVIQDAGWGTMTWTLGLLSGVAAVTTFFFTGGRIMLKGKSSSEGGVV
ncbi:MFS transporter-like protein [Mollisia scopiformis]|uniref:MFS transporter-like protein n=1 Tax=Mollisia scopiformis TaxID=149040 RepID=A0A194X7Q3_MOLSC|nr:MFS transporter-like protein [Mollisia scopiformis]KUJ16200.1 MFS transporter-like protein [Mollisia scopiformis]